MPPEALAPDAGARAPLDQTLPSFGILEAATARAIAPLAPMFVAMAPGWGLDISPAKALRSVLLMAALGENVQALVHRAATETPLRSFLRMSATERLDPTSVNRGQERLITNPLAREVVRTVMATTRAAGLFEHSGFAEDQRLVTAWTRERELDPGDRRAAAPRA